MKFHYIPYLWLLIISALVSLSLGMYALILRRNVKGTSSFILSMIVVTIWSLGNALEMASIDFNTKLFGANIQYFAYCYSPITLLAMSMEFTGYDKWIRSKRILWFAVLPTIIIILAWTDKFHGLIRNNMFMDYSGSFPVINKKYGPFFFIHALYSHSINLLAGALLIKAVFIKNTVYKKQATALFLGLSLIVIPNILYVLGISPIERFDITPVFFGPAGLIIAWGIYRYKLFDLIPIARATVMENMDTGVIVLDLQDRVLDINPAFEKIVGYNVSKSSINTVQEVCAKIPELVSACTDRKISQREFSVNFYGMIKTYEILLSNLTDNKAILIGRLAVIHEITEKKQEQQEYMKQQWEFATVEERERLARDMHDNLGQVLGFINLQAQGIRQELINSGIDIVSSKLDKLINAAQLAHNEIREYICNARNTENIEKNFACAIIKDVFNFENQTGIKVKFDVPIGFSGNELNPKTRINIIYIIKEALNNIRKHANATNVIIIFSKDQEELRILIKDNGNGFDTEQQCKKNNGKFGLKIMQERAAEIGAQICIKSVLGKGSIIKINTPIKEVGKIDENKIDVS